MLGYSFSDLVDLRHTLRPVQKQRRAPRAVSLAERARDAALDGVKRVRQLDKYLILLLRLNRDGDSRRSRAWARLPRWPGRLARLSKLSVSASRGATEYVLLQNISN